MMYRIPLPEAAFSPFRPSQNLWGEGCPLRLLVSPVYLLYRLLLFQCVRDSQSEELCLLLCIWFGHSGVPDRCPECYPVTLATWNCMQPLSPLIFNLEEKNPYVQVWRISGLWRFHSLCQYKMWFQARTWTQCCEPWVRPLSCWVYSLLWHNLWKLHNRSLLFISMTSQAITMKVLCIKK